MVESGPSKPPGTADGPATAPPAFVGPGAAGMPGDPASSSPGFVQSDGTQLGGGRRRHPASGSVLPRRQRPAFVVLGLVGTVGERVLLLPVAGMGEEEHIAPPRAESGTCSRTSCDA